jgi:glutaredoxin
MSQSPEKNLSLPDISNIITTYPVIMFSKDNCIECDKASMFFEEYQIPFHTIKVNKYNELKEYEEWYKMLIQTSGAKSFPIIYMNGQYLGTFNTLIKLHNKGELETKCKDAGVNFCDPDEDF